MTIFDGINEHVGDEEWLIEFLYRFSNDVINQFARFTYPNKENIRNFLEKEIPGSD